MITRRRRHNLPAALRCILALPFLLSCNGGGGSLTAEQHRTVDRWLLCDECTNGERNAVAALGSQAISRLRSALLNGPPTDRRQLMRAKLEERYQSLAPAPAISQADYVNELLNNYIQMYHRRSAIALGDIGGDGARDALDAALAPGHINQYRPDVAREIKFIRTLMTAVPFTGDVTPSEVGVGDTVRVDAPQTAPFTGDELPLFEEAPFAPNEVLISVQAQNLRFLAAGPIGRRALAITNVGATTDTQVTALAIATEMDANDRATAACVEYSCASAAAPVIEPPNFPYVSLLSLRRVPSRPDTIDVFRVHNTSGAPSLPVTAHLLWPATVNANLDLRWTLCASPVAVGNTEGATLANPEATSVSLPPGACYLLAVLMPSGGNELVFARLRVTSP